ncbi:SubName: Full=Uncharacterized protein {ECO:0000313/EMBL:CCA72891.1} [Serendipita indica DSM 11827]|nr:SubName: Full=Uncharacterized protein {ECO:0000313/EMBL:CCA72891.1} [Serendipita indica DSM 11827]
MQLEVILQALNVSRYFAFVATTIAIYDWMLLLRTEVELLGSSRMSIGKVLYYLTRITTIPGLVYGAYRLLTIRVVVLYQRSLLVKTILYLTLGTCYLIAFGVLLSCLNEISSNYLCIAPDILLRVPENTIYIQLVDICVPAGLNSRASIVFEAPLVFEGVMFGALIYRASVDLKSQGSLAMLPLLRVLYRGKFCRTLGITANLRLDGFLFFVIMTAARIWNIYKYVNRPIYEALEGLYSRALSTGEVYGTGCDAKRASLARYKPRIKIEPGALDDLGRLIPMQLTVVLQALNISRYFAFAGATIAIYDWILLLKEEVELLGGTRPSLGKILFYLARITTIPGLIYASYKMNTYVGLVDICVPAELSSRIQVVFEAPLVFEGIMFSTLIYRAWADLKSRGSMGMLPLLRVLYRDGILFFIVMTATRIWNIYKYAKRPIYETLEGPYIMWSIVSVLSCRIYLNIVRAAQNLQQGTRPSQWSSMREQEYSLWEFTSFRRSDSSIQVREEGTSSDGRTIDT